jgi:hypothetical protein
MPRLFQSQGAITARPRKTGAKKKTGFGCFFFFKSELGLNEVPWSAGSSTVSISSHFKNKFGFFLGSKRRDLGFR